MEFEGGLNSSLKAYLLFGRSIGERPKRSPHFLFPTFPEPLVADAYVEEGFLNTPEKLRDALGVVEVELGFSILILEVESSSTNEANGSWSLDSGLLLGVDCGGCSFGVD